MVSFAILHYHSYTYMKRHFTFTDGTSNKFWQIETHKNVFTVTYGRIGNAGQSQTKAFADAATCQKEAEKLIREKTNKGYVEEGQANSTPTVPRSTKSSESTQTIEEMLARYDEIVKNEALDQLLPFLQSVEKQHYEGLKKHIQEIENNWREWQIKLSLSDNKHETYKPILLLPMIVSANKRDLDRWGRLLPIFSNMDNEIFFSVIKWAKPNWIIQYIKNSLSNRIYYQSLDYYSLRKLEDANLIDYDEEIFARGLGGHYWGQYAWGSRMEAMAQRAIKISQDKTAVERDVPLLFKFQNSLIGAECNDTNNNNEVFSIHWWEFLFKRLIDDKKISRNWLLEQFLSTQLRDWPVNFLTHFQELLLIFQPTKSELVTHQSLIFQILASSEKRVVNFAIELLKTIHEQPEFDTAQMLSNLAPVLARSDSKTSLKTLLSILEKLLKTQPEHTAQISLLLVNVFNTNDLTLQERAAKLIAKYANPADTTLCDQLQLYRSQLLGNVPQLLSAFLEQTPEVTTEHERYAYRTPTFTLLREENRVKMPQNWEELLFLIGDFISDGTPLKAEIILNSIVLLKPTFPKDWRGQFKVYYKKMEYDYYAIYRQLKPFLLAWYKEDLRTKMEIEHGFNELCLTESFTVNIITKIQQNYQKNTLLPLLSLPTHEPHWIEPLTLIKRMISHNTAQEEITTEDLALALARVVREKTEEAIDLCEQLLPWQADLLRYVLGASDSISFPQRSGLWKFVLGEKDENERTHSLWAVAARSRFPEKTFEEFQNTTIADLPNVSVPLRLNVKMANVKRQLYSWSPELSECRELTVSLNDNNKLHLWNLYSLDLFEKIKKGGDYWELHRLSYIKPVVWIALTPNYTESLYTNILKYIAYKADVNKSYIFTPVCQHFLQDGFIFREMSLWTLAAILLNQKREDRALAAEVLMHHIERQSLPLEALGQKLGYLLAEEYGPVARLTESLELVKDISPLHNDALRQLIEHILQSMLNGETSAVPKNTKKLLEIYVDVLVKTQTTPSANTRTLLQPYQSVSSLKTIVKTILEK